MNANPTDLVLKRVLGSQEMDFLALKVSEGSRVTANRFPRFEDTVRGF